MPDGNSSPDVNFSSLGQGGGKMLSSVEKPITPEVDPMAHATKLKEGNPADKFDEANLLKALGLPEKDLVKPTVVATKEKKPFSLFKKPAEQPEKAKPTVSQSRGFLMPFINGFNSILESIVHALGSLIPIKKSSGTA